MEVNNILSQKRSLEDSLAAVERKKELLFKENERLKAEWKASRSSADGRSSRQEGPRLTLGVLAQSLTSST